VCRYNWHTAGSLGWPFPTLKYKYIFHVKYTEAILSDSTRKLLLFQIGKMLIAVLKNQFIVLFIITFGTLSFPPYSMNEPAELYILRVFSLVRLVHRIDGVESSPMLARTVASPSLTCCWP